MNFKPHPGAPPHLTFCKEMKTSATLQDDAKRFMERHRWKEAMPILREAILVSPHDPWNVMYLGSCFYELREYSNALRCFQRAEQLDPMNSTPLGLQADATHSLGDAATAKRLYERALDLNPEDELAIKNWNRYTKIEEAEQAGDGDAEEAV